METLSDVLRWAQNLTFLAVGVWALVAWRRRRDAQSGWLGLTFGVLALVVFIGLVNERLGETALDGLITRFTIALIAAFPYLLLRFLGSFEPLTKRLRVAALAAAVVLIGWTELLPEFPEPGEPRSAMFLAYLIAFLAYWFLVLVVVGHRFWVAGRGQPTLARRRLRLLSVASVLLGLVLLVSGSLGGDTNHSVQVVTLVLGLLSAVLFLVGLAPPRLLRVAWRQPEQQQLHQASLGLMTATDPVEVGTILVPHLASVVGARAVALVADGEVVGLQGIGLPEVRAALLEDPDEQVAQLELSNGRILVWTSRYTPFFGQEEMTLLVRLGVLADLALDRTALLARERDARRELERTNQELEAFVYTASHDLKSPLIAMLGYLEVLEAEHRVAIGEQGSWYLQRMQTNGRYMEALIGDLLELSRVGRVQAEPERVNLDQLSERLFDEIGERFPGATFTVEGQLPTVWINPTRARQLLGNLLENAGKYGGEGVTVTVSCRSLDDGGVEVQVRDDGVGIPEEYAEKVFAVFERLVPDDNRSGTGIGLAICRKITEAAGGDIRLVPSDRGADFRIRFPSEATRQRLATDRSQEVPA